MNRKKRERLVYDENVDEWRPRHGINRANNLEDDWVIEARGANGIIFLLFVIFFLPCPLLSPAIAFLFFDCICYHRYFRGSPFCSQPEYMSCALQPVSP